MSDVAAAAAALGIPEPLVERSAAARAAAAGIGVDELLAMWSGGQAAPAAAPPPSAPAAPEPEAETPDATAEDAAPTPVIVLDVPETPPAQPAEAGPYKPPVLVGAKDSPMTVLAAAAGLFLIVLLVGLVGPSIPFDSPGARTSDLPYSEAALHGQDLYQTTGCASCHTQMVRPVIADVGLGAVSLNDTNQVLGTRRFGPDLSDVGTRMGPDEIEAVIAGAGEHPALQLSADDMSDLVSYLSESKTTVTDGGDG